ncbi:MAG: hypothetical protein IIB57_13400 [Planctomycetes bacterium]|nr:hypothetical protein [Planctomycetota bacterium]
MGDIRLEWAKEAGLRGPSRQAKDAGIPDVIRHDIRQAGITGVRLNSMPPVAVERMAGHAHLETTRKHDVPVNRRHLPAAITGCREAAVV